MFPHCSLWKTNWSPFISGISPVGAKMEVFVLAGRAWELPAGLLLPSTEIVRNPESVCQEQVVTQAATRVVLPPTATARRQHSQRQGEERCELVYCQLVSEMPHMLKTLPSVKWGLFDSRVFLFSVQDPGKIEGPQRFLGLEVVSRLQKVEDVITCKWSDEW